MSNNSQITVKYEIDRNANLYVHSCRFDKINFYLATVQSCFLFQLIQNYTSSLTEQCWKICQRAFILASPTDNPAGVIKLWRMQTEFFACDRHEWCELIDQKYTKIWKKQRVSLIEWAITKFYLTINFILFWKCL